MLPRQTMPKKFSTWCCGNGGSHFRKAHNMCCPNLPFVCRYESLLKLSSSAEPQSPV
jgi:hypothetical protein